MDHTFASGVLGYLRDVVPSRADFVCLCFQPSLPMCPFLMKRLLMHATASSSVYRHDGMYLYMLPRHSGRLLVAYIRKVEQSLARFGRSRELVFPATPARLDQAALFAQDLAQATASSTGLVPPSRVEGR
jgi:hypothetical protein